MYSDVRIDCRFVKDFPHDVLKDSFSTCLKRSLIKPLECDDILSIILEFC